MSSKKQIRKKYLRFAIYLGFHLILLSALKPTLLANSKKTPDFNGKKRKWSGKHIVRYVRTNALRKNLSKG